MERSEKEELLEEIKALIHREVGPVMETVMNYVDDRFDETDERFFSLFAGIDELLDKLSKALEH
jgi:hypothetical protein